MTHGGGDVGFQNLRFDRVEEPRIDEPVEPSDVHGEHRVRRVVLARGLDLVDHALLGEDHVDVDPGLLGELRENGLDEEGLAIGIEVDFGCDHRGGEEPGRERAEECGGKTGLADSRGKDVFHFRFPPRVG